jgi:hypothetical protein
VVLLELYGIWKPAERIAERIDRKSDHDITTCRRVVVGKQGLAILPDLDAKADEIALGAVDASRLELGFEQNVASVEIGKAHAPGVRALRHQQPAAIVEVVAKAAGAFLGGNIGRLKGDAFDRSGGHGFGGQCGW